MNVTPERVREEYEFVRDRPIAPLITEVRAELGELFGTDVAGVSTERYRQEVDAVFADGDRAVNVAALVAILRELDVEGDYPGFVVDEQLGRKLAATIAGGEPLTTLAEATFHYADVHVHGDESEGAGLDDLDAALAAGVQTRLPGWEWQESASPFAVGPDAE
ncbi:hypothetical protein [Halomarina oriensis]|uniref:DUF7984 domain-containing protein n=1 Tax=Halomarina oriensis TaxID=671145 RepID=A0A6B0GUR3_9EURY|nr:hypothetical protein [Halomarina oriensis]MWG35875.1 hypothetical protein [Halomarina oriensis]